MRKTLKNPLFHLGLIIRFFMLLAVMPQPALHWYVPFLDTTTQHLTFDPWKTFLAAGGSDIAFPYGYAMWFAFIPLTLICKIIGASVYLGYGLTLLGFDLALLFILRLLFKTTDKFLLATYWLSPIILFSTYWLGLNDLIPITLLCAALYFTKEKKLIQAGIFCGLAISAKLSMILAIPFFAIYLFRNRALRSLLLPYINSLSAITLALGLPFVVSHDALFMLTHNPEMGKIYQLTLNIGETTLIYLLPMVYLLMLYLAWHVRRINFELLNLLFGLSFFLVVLLTPASPGWFIWAMPLLILYQASRGSTAILLVGIFSSLFIAINFLTTQNPLILGNHFADTFAINLNQFLGMHGIAYLHTIFLALGVVLVVRIWQELIKANEYFRLSRKPFVVGIAGDSGSGKDTLSACIQNLFGQHSVTAISGDDYHLWDRQKPIWQVMTHLNPRANDLERYTQDLMALSNGKTIYSRHYNHENGKMTRPYKVKSNDFIIASGLHALSLPMMRNCYDLTIYLDINEDLRRYFKIQRDVNLRGHSLEKVLVSLNTREEDSKKFVKPQIVHADLVMSLQPIHPRILEAMDDSRPVRLKLSVSSRRGLNEESLVKALVGICGLHVDMEMNSDNNEVQLTVEGETTADDIAFAAKRLFPLMHEFLDAIPRWEDGVRGLMQLITLSHINQSLSERLL